MTIQLTDLSPLPDAEAPRDCPLCPRLVAFRQLQRAEHPDWWNAPVPAFGDPDAWLAIVGLAPGKHGAHRTITNAPQGATTTRNVLIVGNSLSYFNEMPWMYEQIALSKKEGIGHLDSGGGAGRLAPFRGDAPA